VHVHLVHIYHLHVNSYRFYTERYELYFFQIALRRSYPISDCSFTSITPITNRSSVCSSVQSDQSTIPEIETKRNEISSRLQQLQSEATFIVNDFFPKKKQLSFLSIRQLNTLYIERITWMNFFQMVIVSQ
jgi:hypothetical protein